MPIHIQHYGLGSLKMNVAQQSSVCYFMWRKNRPTQAIPPRVKIWLKSKTNFTSRRYCSCRHRCCWCCSVDKDVLQSLSNVPLTEDTKFLRSGRGKKCVTITKTTTRSYGSVLGRFLLPKMIYCTTYVLVWWGKKRARTHTHTRACTHPQARAPNLFHVLFRTKEYKWSTNTTFSYEFYMCLGCETKVANIPGDARTSRWSTQCVNWCDL